jgi:flagellar hook-associated protein 3 FlgL
MRVTDKLMFQHATRDTASARARAEEALARASTGVRVQHPADDPSGAGLLTLHRATAARLEAVGGVAQRAADELSAVDGALGEITNLLARARELTIQMSNGTMGAAERADAAGEAQSLQDAVIAALNTRVGTRYVFGGTADAAPPFDPTGAYLGDTGVRRLEIAPGVLQDASVRADVAVKGAGGGVDVLAAFGALVTALQANDQAGTAAVLTQLDQGTTQLASARSQAGVAMNAFDTAVSASRAARDEATARAGGIADADPIEAASELALAQRALEASLTAAAQGFQLTLLDRLK